MQSAAMELIEINEIGKKLNAIIAAVTNSQMPMTRNMTETACSFFIGKSLFENC
jgi:hypothetical protein